jgi:hypothetical protein
MIAGCQTQPEVIWVKFHLKFPQLVDKFIIHYLIIVFYIYRLA